MTNEQVAFEKWFTAAYSSREGVTKIHDGITYASWETQRLWEVWRSRAALDKPADEPTADLIGLLREVLIADDGNVDTATTLPYELTDRIRAAVTRSENITG